MQEQHIIEVSVVVIARNEEAGIGACLESALEQTKNLEREVILVDSRSTDRTVEIARCYPVTVIRIENCSAYSPAAGRYLGTQQAKGKYVLFLDGDMVLMGGWMDVARAELADDAVAGVAGRVYRVFPGERLNYKHRGRHPVGTVPYLAGAAMYKRDVLQQVGTFNPFMAGEEERELGYRIGQAGFTLHRLDAPMVYHLEKPRTRSETGEKAMYFTGVGQIFRHYGSRRISWQLAKAHRNLFFIYLLAFLTIALLIDVFTEGLMELFYISIASILVAILVLAYVKGIRKVGLFVRGIRLNGLFIIRGYRRGIRPATEFQATTSIVDGTAHADHELVVQ